MTTADQIPTDLALEIGVNPSPERFLLIVRAFFGYVDEVTSAVSADTDAIRWSVVVKEGSAFVGVQPSVNTPPEILRRVYARARSGVDQIAGGHFEESRLSESALKHLRVLAGLGEGVESQRTPVRLWIERRPSDLTTEMAHLIEDDWRADYRDYGSVDGRLEMIQDNDGRLQLRVRDAGFRQTVKCRVPDDMLDEVLSNFRKRVEISGIIHYRRNGAAISIDVDRIQGLPDDSELPTADDVRGILKIENGRRADLLG